MAADVGARSLHRGACETTLSDEESEPDPDRWCAHAACGHDAWHIISPWVWTLRLEVGHHREPEPRRLTACAPALASATEHTAPASGSAAASVAVPFNHGRVSGRDGALQPDGTLRCPAGHALTATEERREGDGRRRLVDAARIRQCRGCRRRAPCQWHGGTTQTPRRVRVVLHPLPGGSAPVPWRDWSRRQHRRACMHLVRHQRVAVHREPLDQPGPAPSPPILARAHRAHARRSWDERLACHASPSPPGRSTITRVGMPEGGAASLGLLTASHRDRSLVGSLSSGKQTSPSGAFCLLCPPCSLCLSLPLLCASSTSALLLSSGHALPF